MEARFGPVHNCRRCGVEIQLVKRSFGRAAYEETATGVNHRYNCAGRDAETAAMVAKVMEPQYMSEAEAPAPRVKVEAPNNASQQDTQMSEQPVRYQPINLDVDDIE